MTSATGEAVVAVSRRIGAPPEDIFRILADPGGHRDLDGSGMLRGGVFDAVVSGIGDTDAPWVIWASTRRVDLDGGSWGASRLTCSGRGVWRWQPLPRFSLDQGRSAEIGTAGQTPALRVRAVVNLPGAQPDGLEISKPRRTLLEQQLPHRPVAGAVTIPSRRRGGSACCALGTGPFGNSARAGSYTCTVAGPGGSPALSASVMLALPTPMQSTVVVCTERRPPPTGLPLLRTTPKWWHAVPHDGFGRPRSPAPRRMPQPSKPRTSRRVARRADDSSYAPAIPARCPGHHSALQSRRMIGKQLNIADTRHRLACGSSSAGAANCAGTTARAWEPALSLPRAGRPVRQPSADENASEA